MGRLTPLEFLLLTLILIWVFIPGWIIGGKLYEWAKRKVRKNG